MQDRYFSCAEISKMTGKSKRTIWNWCRLGKLKAGRPGGRDYIIKESDFLEFMTRDNRKKDTN